MRRNSVRNGMLLLTLAASQAMAAAGDVTLARLRNADHEPQNWLTIGRDLRQDYYSPLSAIDTHNAARLGLAWAYDMQTNRGQEATPLVVDGVMYTSGYTAHVYALDAATGRELWHFRPDIDPRPMRDACCDSVNRGVAVLQGRVYVGSIDGRLHALDAASGRELWSVDTIENHKLPYTVTSAPLIAGRLIVLGNAGGDMGNGGVRGYVSAYDAATGAFKWRCYTVPPAGGRKPETEALRRAAATWPANRATAYPGGATAWDGMTYDPELKLVYFGTGNAAPYDLSRLGTGGGDLLYAASILAVDAASGRLVWHYQTTPRDRFDFDATQKLIRTQMNIGGATRQVLMQANKNGFFYVLDAANGALLAAAPFAHVTWASGIDPATARPAEAPGIAWEKAPAAIYPSAYGAHTWHPMSADPRSGLVYIPVKEQGNVLVNLERNGGSVHAMDGAFATALLTIDSAYDAAALAPLYGKLPAHPGPGMYEVLRAFNPATGNIVWEQRSSSGIAGNDGGVLSTGGDLVIQGHGDGNLAIYDSRNGKLLKSIATGSHIMAAPIAYAVQGVEYIAVQTGLGGAAISTGPIPASSAAHRYDNENRILAFRLDGGAVPLPAPRADPATPKPPQSHASKAEIAAGGALFNANCSGCHVFGPGLTPDLSRLPEGVHAAFRDIVLGGVLAANGMESFADRLTPRDVDSIHAYLIDQQQAAFSAGK